MTLPTPQGRWCPTLDTVGNGTTTLTDLSGNSRHGTLTDMDPATCWIPDTGHGGVRALDFDGTNDQITYSGTLLPTNTTAVTLAYWMRRPTAGAFGPFFGLGIGTITNRIEVEPYTDNQLYVSFSGADYAWIALDQAWHHYAVVYDGAQTGNDNRLKIYKDGVAESPSFAGTVPANIGTSALSLRLGRGHFGNFGAGLIDDALVFDVAMTAEDIAYLASAPGCLLPVVPASSMGTRINRGLINHGRTNAGLLR
jgi:hypothetical protein